jgi:hypothetical protein
MATGAYKGDVYTLQDTPMIGTLPNALLAGGHVYCSVDRVVTATASGLTLGTTMKLGKLPKGAIVLYSIIYPIATATFDAPDATTGATTGSVGIAGDTDLFGTFTTLASAVPQILMPKPDGTTYTNRLKPLKTEVDILLTSAAVDWTTAEGVCLMVFYQMI